VRVVELRTFSGEYGKEREMKQVMILVMVLFVAGCMTLSEKNTTLLSAVESGDLATVQRMLDAGADVNMNDFRGTPLQAAISHDRAEIANLLISRGADFNVSDRYGDMPLHLAIKENMRSTVQALLDKGADANAEGALGDTPLHVARYRRSDELSAMLEEEGADEELLNRYGLRPRDMIRVLEIEAKVNSLANLLNDYDGSWADRQAARLQYDHLKSLPVNEVINALVLQTIERSRRRFQVLLVAIKLGIPGSEEKLSDLLMVYGNQSMAEDYLNSGSSLLGDAGTKWANEHGYNIRMGQGSHRGSWGSFQ
jgi:hypothetical protein